jgi:hypothetical protein
MPLSGGSYETHNHHLLWDRRGWPRSVWLCLGTDGLSESCGDGRPYTHRDALTVGKRVAEREPLTEPDRRSLWV